MAIMDYKEKLEKTNKNNKTPSLDEEVSIDTIQTKEDETKDMVVNEEVNTKTKDDDSEDDSDDDFDDFFDFLDEE